MNFSFHPEAEEEFLRAIDFYERRAKNLALESGAETYTAVRLVTSLPDAWPILESDVRKGQTQRFRYGVLNSRAAEGVFIPAGMHLHRDPDYWKHRIEPQATMT
ncbi:MAG TPA: hypothetical protein PLU87_03685 [Sedimentisphaerales bacterium]|nr:hypothetical protein [Sedimentisphaerales bacterium]HRS10304.1 hypothetical protein [Sedimentisphaerales bacterium]HRV47009.1 hypothetical protein [Sedimentisphaerales bacterium]